jgi:hypothetical protein
VQWACHSNAWSQQIELSARSTVAAAWYWSVQHGQTRTCILMNSECDIPIFKAHFLFLATMRVMAPAQSPLLGCVLSIPRRLF